MPSSMCAAAALTRANLLTMAHTSTIDYDRCQQTSAARVVAQRCLLALGFRPSRLPDLSCVSCEQASALSVQRRIQRALAAATTVACTTSAASGVPGLHPLPVCCSALACCRTLHHLPGSGRHSCQHANRGPAAAHAHNLCIWRTWCQYPSGRCHHTTQPPLDHRACS